MRRFIVASYVFLILLSAITGCSSREDKPSVEPKEQPLIIEETPAQALEPIKEPLVSVEVSATPIPVSICIDGRNAVVYGYEIGGENFYRLRDIAYLVKDTPVEFEVKWDQDTEAVSLFTKQQYTENGSELTGGNSGGVSAWSNISPILLDEKELGCDSFLIDGTYYFKLRDMGQALNFSVGWSSALGQVLVNTSKPYGEEPITLEEEYQLIVDRQPLYDPGMDRLWDPIDGLCYADMVDFESDGTPELVLISAKRNEGELATYDMRIDVYGDAQGRAVKYDSPVSFTWDFWGERDISFVKSAGKTYLYCYNFGGGNETPQTHNYYGIKDNSFAMIDTVTLWQMGWSDEINDHVVVYYSGDLDNEITEQELNNTINKYANDTNIVSFFDGSFRVLNRGILPEAKGISVEVNGEKLEFGDAMFVKDAHVIAPILPVLEKIGVGVVKNEEGTQILASTKRDSLEIYDGLFDWGNSVSGEYGARVNGKYTEFYGLRPQMVNNQLIAPLRPIAQMFGATVTWDSSTRILSIQGSIPSKERISESELQALMEFSVKDAERIASWFGYTHAYAPDDEFGGGSGFANGKAFIWLWALPAGMSEEYAIARYDMGIYEYQLIWTWSDGTMTLDEDIDTVRWAGFAPWG